jgi:hypothetical protein
MDTIKECFGGLFLIDKLSDRRCISKNGARTAAVQQMR